MQNTDKRKYFTAFIAVGAVISVASGCAPKISDTQKEAVSARNLVVANDPQKIQIIGDSKRQYTIMAEGAFQAQVKSGILKETRGARGKKRKWKIAENSASNAASETAKKALLFGLPLDQLDKPMYFGSVITQVSDGSSEDLGNLKLSDLPPFTVLARLHKIQSEKDGKNDGKNADVADIKGDKSHKNRKSRKDPGEVQYAVALMDCAGDCSNTAAHEALIDIPVSGVDLKKEIVFLDLAILGEALDLAAIHKEDSRFTRFHSVASTTVKFDYSNSTLVFDVEAHLVDQLAAFNSHPSPETVITNRWYLRPKSAPSTTFVAREATPGVGFFTTTPDKKSGSKVLINHWDFENSSAADGIKYYIKHVPTEYQAAFAQSFDEWNNNLLPIIGKKIFNYEFIPENDERNELLVSGDIRYNIIEWDLLNKATYGGLGPSIANNETGEIFQANVLIQGPSVVELYTKWFNIQHEAAKLSSIGKSDEAELLLVRMRSKIDQSIRARNARTYEVKFGEKLKMRVHSQESAFEDPVMSRDDFDQIPDNYDYSTYMAGYFHDMVAHELGHNLGLRHNFKGSLGAQDSSVPGGVSRSIMEYLGRGYRYLDEIGPYDLMAISYGYKGIAPSYLDWYCTDEDTADLFDPSKSAECTPSDATNDPFTYFLTRFSRAADLAVAKGKDSAPEWTLEDLAPDLKKSLRGLGSYGLSAEQTASTWTNFFKGGDRPALGSNVKEYVLSKVKSVLCNPNLGVEVSKKATEDAKSKTNTNLNDFRIFATDVLEPVFSASELACPNSSG